MGLQKQINARVALNKQSGTCISVSCLGNRRPSPLASVPECLLSRTGRAVLPGMPPEVDRGRVVISIFDLATVFAFNH